MNVEHFEGDELLEKASDTEVALFFIQHIGNPCEDMKGNTIRDFYVREARKALEKMKTPHAKELLEKAIEQYTK